MTPIEISERVIAVEVPNGTLKCIVSNTYTPILKAIDSNDFYCYINLPILPIWYSYKYTCLLSDLADCKYTAQFTVDEIVLIHERVKPNTEYALITREKDS